MLVVEFGNLSLKQNLSPWTESVISRAPEAEEGKSSDMMVGLNA